MMTDCTLIKNLLFHLKKLEGELFLNKFIYKLLINLLLIS